VQKNRQPPTKKFFGLQLSTKKIHNSNQRKSATPTKKFFFNPQTKNGVQKNPQTPNKKSATPNQKFFKCSLDDWLIRLSP